MDSDQAEVHFINVTLRRLELEIRHLHHLRSKLHRRLNELTTLTNNLPPELLSRIFEIALGNKNKYAQNLAAVCSRWRNITDSMPTLWQTLAVRFRVENEVPLNTLSLVQYYVQRVGLLPMTLKIRYDQEDFYSTYNQTLRVSSQTFFEQGFQTCSDSLGMLILENIPQVWWFPLSSSTSRSTTYPSLKYISLSWPVTPETVVLFQHNTPPRLNHVSLSGWRFPVDLPWRQLITLNLNNLIISQCLNMLVACPLLKEFNCRNPTPTFDETAESIARQISQAGVFTHMKRMSWDFGLDDWDAALMDNARFPSLKWMTWRRHASGALATQAFHGSSFDPISHNEFVSSLQALTVFRASLHLWTIEDLCAVLPDTLQELYLTGDSLESRLPHCLGVLTLHRGNGSGSCGYFPHLRVFGLPDLCVCPKPVILMNSLLNMLRSRRPPAIGASEFLTRGNIVFLERLCFSLTRAKTEWDRDQVNSLQEIIRQGLILETGEGRHENQTWLSA